MPKHAKTLQIIEQSQAILREQHPMTVRQVYYQLVSRLVIENTRSQWGWKCSQTKPSLRWAQ